MRISDWSSDVCSSDLAELPDLFDGIDGDVARPRDDDALAVERPALGFQHPLDEIDEAEAGCLGSRARPAIDQSLTGEHTSLVTVGAALVLAETRAGLSPAQHAHDRRDRRIHAQMELQHN